MHLNLDEDIRQILSSVAELTSVKKVDELDAHKNGLVSACQRMREHKLTAGDKREILAKYAEFALNRLHHVGYNKILDLLSLLTCWPVNVVHDEIQERMQIDQNLKIAFQICPQDEVQ